MYIIPPSPSQTKLTHWPVIILEQYDFVTFLTRNIIHLLTGIVLWFSGMWQNRHLYGLSGHKPAHKVVNRLITTHVHVWFDMHQIKNEMLAW